MRESIHYSLFVYTMKRRRRDIASGDKESIKGCWTMSVLEKLPRIISHPVMF